MLNNVFEEYFPDGILPDMVVPYAHKNKWAVHHVLPFVFSEIGPFHLDLATFNISDEAIRYIYLMKERGELLSVRFLLDNIIKQHKVDMMYFSANVADIVRNAHSHMKLLLCHNDTTCLSVVGSANMNKNTRHEAGFFSTDRNIFDYYLDYFEDIFVNDSRPFIWD